jgi:hypothetical protein
MADVIEFTGRPQAASGGRSAGAREPEFAPGTKTSARADGCGMARGAASNRWQAADFEQLEAERLDLGEHAVERSPVAQRPGQHVSPPHA